MVDKYNNNHSLIYKYWLWHLKKNSISMVRDFCKFHFCLATVNATFITSH
jgi:hypothetical protein